MHDDHERFHDDCAGCRAEMDESYREHIGSWRAERQHRESLELARQDLDMPHASEAELQTAIYLGLK
jgi:hypothetical protein